MNFRLDSCFDRSRANRMILLQEHPGELENRSLVFATGYKAWTEVKQLECVEKWLCDTRLPDVPRISPLNRLSAG